MKRTLIILTFLALAIGVNAQTNAYDGLHVGSKATKVADSHIRRINVNESDSTVYFYDKNGKLLNPKLNSNGWIDNATVFSKLAPDTVQHTANYTVQASDWGKDQHLRKATSMVITLPPNLTEWPVGGIINFYGGIGITVFKKGAGVVFESPLDSIATSAKYEGISVLKIAASKYRLTGALKD